MTYPSAINSVTADLPLAYSEACDEVVSRLNATGLLPVPAARVEAEFCQSLSFDRLKVRGSGNVPVAEIMNLDEVTGCEMFLLPNFNCVQVPQSACEPLMEYFRKLMEAFTLLDSNFGQWNE